MTEPEAHGVEGKSGLTWLNLLVVLAIVSILSTTAIIVATSMKLGAQTDLIAEQRRNHEASTCLISVIHAISASSGKDPAESRKAYQVIFGEQWLVDHCALTPEEARKVVSDG